MLESNTMREGMIIVPKYDNAGNPLVHVVDECIKAMADAYGGVTVREAFGAWRNPKTGEMQAEPVVELVSAYNPESLADDAKLTDLARTVADKGGQHSVYIRYASGDVEIIDFTEASGRKYPKIVA
jgi:hypothetical protein